MRFGDEGDVELDVITPVITQRGGVEPSKAILPVLLLGALIAIAIWKPKRR